MVMKIIKFQNFYNRVLSEKVKNCICHQDTKTSAFTKNKLLITYSLCSLVSWAFVTQIHFSELTHNNSLPFLKIFPLFFSDIYIRTTFHFNE